MNHLLLIYICKLHWDLTKSYGMYDWREDIKKVMNRAGVAAKPTVFMIDDSQLVCESFLEDINGILNTGEVANLLNAEEMGVLQVHFL